MKEVKISEETAVGRLGWKWTERSVLQLLLLKQKKAELLLKHITLIIEVHKVK